MSFTDAASTPPERLRIGYCATPAVRGLRPAPEHVAALERTADALREAGHDVREVNPHYPDVTAMFTPQYYGGVRDEATLVERPELLERRTKQTLALARLMPERAIQWSVDNTEKFAAKVNRIFDDVDLLLTPTITHRPRRIGALDGANSLTAQLRSLPMIAYTALWNVAGNPAAAVPAGFGTDGLPLSVQLVGKPHDEVSILQVATQLETARPWAQHRPTLG